MGNHDRVAAGLEEPNRFNRAAQEAILWTREALTKENRDFLASLPDQMFIGDSIVLVHGSPRDRNEYIMSTDNAEENMRYMREKFTVTIGFFGHTHAASLFVQKGDSVAQLEPVPIILEGGSLYLINPGSIGQPRDGDVRASFLVHDYEASSVEFFRVEYDIDAVSRAILDAGLPRFLARRLFLGR
jgi:diadenosine tetraphosphatase ApaH/serine/threonine PP2A family protein phosphatase